MSISGLHDWEMRSGGFREATSAGDFAKRLWLGEAGAASGDLLFVGRLVEWAATQALYKTPADPRTRAILSGEWPD